MLERVPEAEEEQQQRTFGPCPQRSGASGCDQHQGVDFELLQPEVVDRLAQRKEPAKEISRDIAGGWHPFWCAGNQPSDRIADPQHRAAGEREDQLGIGAEEFGVAMVVAITRAVLLFARIAAHGAVIVAGMFVGSDPLGNPHLQLAKCSAHFLFCGLSAIIFDPDRPAGAGACLYHPGQCAQRIADRPRPPFVTDPRHLPDHMSEAFGDFGTCGAHHFAQSWQRQLGGVEMNAQRRRRVAVEANHMRPLHAFSLG